MEADRTAEKTGRLGILAGSGQGPIEAAAAAASRGEDPHIVALLGTADRGVEAYPHTWVGLGQVGALVEALRRHDCTRLLIIGGLKRPDLFRLRIDLGFVRHLPTIAGILRGGDDAVLRRVITFFEAQGLEVVGVPDVAPGLLAESDAIAGPEPSPACHEAIAVGARALADLSQFDAGQACVARRDGVLAFEDGAGTTDMLARLASRGGAGGDAVLVKLPKRNQEMRVDLPAIGTETVREISAAGISGVAVAAGRTVVLERSRMVEAAARAGVFVVGVPANLADDPSLAANPYDDDQKLALAYVRRAWSHLVPETRDFGAVVRRGHVYASLRDGISDALWRSRLVSLSRAGPLGMLWQQRGAIAVARAPVGASSAEELDAIAQERGLRTVDVFDLPTPGGGQQ